MQVQLMTEYCRHQSSLRLLPWRGKLEHNSNSDNLCSDCSYHVIYIFHGSLGRIKLLSERTSPASHDVQVESFKLELWSSSIDELRYLWTLHNY